MEARALIRERPREEDTPSASRPEDAAPAKQDPGVDVEDQTAADADPEAELPTLEPPRSWTAEQKAKFAALPRDVQEISLDHEKRREADFRRIQNEQAEARKAAQAEREQFQAQRAQYENLLPQLQAATQSKLSSEFSDIRSWDDVHRLAAENPDRYAEWHALTQQQQAVQAEQKRLTEQRQVEAQTAFQTFATDQDKLASQAIPELADPKKAERAIALTKTNLVDAGFSEDELGALWNGQKGISLRDARLQAILYDAARYRDAQKAAKTAAQKPVPHVMRPGTAPNKGLAAAQRINDLNARFDQTGSIRDAFALLKATKKN